MKRFLFLAVYFSLVFSVSGATKDDPSVTVTGEAALRVPADRAYILLYTYDQDNSSETVIKESLQDVEKVMTSPEASAYQAECSNDSTTIWQC